MTMDIARMLILSFILTGFVQAKIPRSYVVVDHCDIAEINHFYSGDDGSIVFDQIIFWRWSWIEQQFVVAEWRMVEGARDSLDKLTAEEVNELKAKQPIIETISIKHGMFKRMPVVPNWNGKSNLIPTLQPNGKYRAIWIERDGTTRKVWVNHVRETWTTHDPEVKNRDIISQSHREGFQKGRIDKHKVFKVDFYGIFNFLPKK